MIKDYLAAYSAPKIKKQVQADPYRQRRAQNLYNTGDGGYGGQCGAFVNDLTGLGVGDSYQSKIAKMDPNIKVPKPGMAFVMPYKEYGHTGIIEKVNKDGTATVRDSNYGLDEKVRVHNIPISQMTGFANVSGTKKEEYKGIANGVIALRKKGMTDTDILENLTSKYPEFAKPIKQSRLRYNTDKNIKNDRDLTNFLAKKYSGVEKLLVASNPLPNPFKASGYEKDQIVKIGKEHGLSEDMVAKLYDAGEAERFQSLLDVKVQQFDAEAQAGVEQAIDRTLKPVNWLFNKIGDVLEMKPQSESAKKYSEFFQKHGLEGLATAANKSASIIERYNPVALVSKLGSVIGATAGFTTGVVGSLAGQAIEDQKIGTGVSLGTAVEEGKSMSGKASEKGGEFSKAVARSGPLFFGGKAIIGLMAIPKLGGIADDITNLKKDGLVPLAEDLAFLGLDALGYKYTRGRWIDKDAAKVLGGAVIDLGKGVKNTISKGVELAKTPIGTTASKIDFFTKKRSEFIGAMPNDIDKLYRLPKGYFGSKVQRDAYYAKQINALSRMVENPNNLKFSNEAGEIVNRLPESLEDASIVMQKEKKAVFEAWQQSIVEAGGKEVKIDTGGIVENLEKIANDQSILTHSPSTAKYAEESAERLRGQSLTIKEIDERITLLNERSNFFKSNKAFTADDFSKASIDEGMAKAYRKKLDDAVNSATGDNIQDLKNYYGSLSEAQKRIEARYQLERNRLTKGLIDYSDFISSGQIVGGVFSGNPGQIATGVTTNIVKNIFKKLNSPDAQIKGLFQKADAVNKLNTEIAGRMKKVFSTALNEALKNQKYIGGVIKKGFFIDGISGREEALEKAELAFSQLATNRVDDRLGYSLHAWVEKNGKIFDTFYNDGFVKDRVGYVSEENLMTYLENKAKYPDLYRKPETNPSRLLEESKTIPLPDKYANLPNKGSFVKGVDAEVISARDVQSGRFTKAYTSDGKGSNKLYTNAVGAIAGLREDENGNIYFDPKFALMGIAGFMVGKKTLDLVKKDILNIVKLTDGEIKAVDKLLGPDHQNILSEFRAASMDFAKDKMPESTFHKIVNKLDEQWKALAKNEEGFAKIPGKEEVGFKDSGDLTLKVFKSLEGKTEIPKNEIVGIMNKGGIKQQEKDLVNKYLEKQQGNKINIEDMANTLKAELLPLKRTGGGKFETQGFGSQYESISLPDDIKGEISNYKEIIYESPIKTSAGDIHWKDANREGYFGHTRIEDMADRNTRRVIEVQSDLYQKGNLERELESQGAISKQWEKEYKEKNPNTTFSEMFKDWRNVPYKEKAKLMQYSNPTAHFRMVREEVKQAAIDGKSKLQFPTGETAMKIEGLGGDNQVGGHFVELKNGKMGENLKPENIKVGKEVADNGANVWIITENIGDGKFKAVPKISDDDLLDRLKEYHNEVGEPMPVGLDLKRAIKEMREEDLDLHAEQFDISGKIDTNNPIYKFYEKDLGRYLQKEYGAKFVTDDKGVKWYEIDVDQKLKDLPINAFGFASVESMLKASTGMLAAMGLYKTAKGEIKELKGGADEQDKDTVNPEMEMTLDENGKVISNKPSSSLPEQRTKMLEEQSKKNATPIKKEADLNKGNIDLNNRPIIKNSDNSISTVRSISINEDGKEVLIPTVRKGLDRIMTNQEAIDWYKKTGEHLGKFNSIEEADKYAEELHQQQEKQYKKPNKKILDITDDQKIKVIATIIGEGLGEGEKGMQAILNNMINRAENNYKGKDLFDVASKGNGGQYNAFASNNSLFVKVRDYMRGEKETTPNIKRAVDAVVSMIEKYDKGELEDLTNGSLNYLNPHITTENGKRMAGFNKRDPKKDVVVGNHTFWNY